MSNFDFHNTLSPDDFERLIRSILEVRDKPLKFRTFKRGRDEGIDIECTNSSDKIIGQAKLYQQNYPQLKASLLKEAIKVQKLKPQRYILATSVSLSPKNLDEIMNLFNGFIKTKEDVLDREQINKYLEQNEHLLKIYSKLFFPNVNILENVLSDIVNNRIKNQTISSLKEIQKINKVYVKTNSLKTALNYIKEKHVLIITGDPGIGKTTLALMLVKHLIEDETALDYYCVRNLEQIEDVKRPDKSQVFFLDDFWGQNFEEKNKKSDEPKYFLRFLNDMRDSNNHYLVLCSRDYIIKSVILKNDEEFQLTIQNFTLNLNSSGLSDKDKVKILLNHLYISNFNKEYFSILEYGKRLESIIEHSNYSPRHIEYFIKYIFPNYIKKAPEKGHLTFYNRLFFYLEKPLPYWDEVFRYQSDTSKLILLLILISSDPIAKSDLVKSFKKIQNEVRNKLNRNIDPLDFESELYSLEELFIKTAPIDSSDDILIYFQTQGIKDYLLEYLRKEITFYGEILIDKASYFNQLYFVFTTSPKDEIEDSDSEVYLYGKKILLDEELQSILKKKILREFHELFFCSQEREYAARLLPTDSSEGIKYWKLWIVSTFFDINSSKHSDIRSFIVKEVKKDISHYSQGIIGYDKIVSSKSMDTFPRIIKLVKPFLDIDRSLIITAYHGSITLTEEFLWLNDFHEIFPDEFETYKFKHIKRIRSQIKKILLEEIDYYRSEIMDFQLDVLLGPQLEEVCKVYGLRITKEFQKEIEDHSERKLKLSRAKERRYKQRNIKNHPYNQREENNNNLHQIVKEFISNESKPVNLDRYLNLTFNDSQKIKAIISFLKTSLLKESFINDIHSVNAVLDFFKNNHLNSFENSYTFYDNFSNYYFKKISINLDSNEQNIFNFLVRIALECNSSDHKTVTTVKIKELFEKYCLSELNDVNILYPLIVKRNHFFELLNPGLLHFFVAKNIISKNDLDYRNTVEELIEKEVYVEDILNIISEANNHRFTQNLLLPYLSNFIESVKKTTDEEKTFSMIEYFEVYTELLWDKKRKTFIDNGGGNGRIFFNQLLSFLGIDFEPTSLNVYFLKEYYNRDNLESLFIQKEYFEELYNRVLSSYEPKKMHDFLKKQDRLSFEFSLSDFAKSPRNYQALKHVGMEKYLLKLHNDIETTYNKLKFNR